MESRFCNKPRTSHIKGLCLMQAGKVKLSKKTWLSGNIESFQSFSQLKLILKTYSTPFVFGFADDTVDYDYYNI